MSLVLHGGVNQLVSYIHKLLPEGGHLEAFKALDSSAVPAAHRAMTLVGAILDCSQSGKQAQW